MPNKSLKLGDLVNRENLKKPAKNLLKIELAANPEKIQELSTQLSAMATGLEENKNLQVGEMVNLVETTKKSLIRELSPEKAEEIIVIQKNRFLKKQKSYQALSRIQWNDVEKRLRQNPEKIWSLSEMESTGGMPELFDQHLSTHEYIFIDCSPESPRGRRNCCYHQQGQQEAEKKGERPAGNAFDIAKMMGIDLLTEDYYLELQKRGEFDMQTSSWLESFIDSQNPDIAHCGRRHWDDVRIDMINPTFHHGTTGFRGMLTV